ncbi:MAG: DUF3418 domain-containing protein, partial [Opitutaceae bacterium]|nr:DUF3418 domain-containing protein [Opitutaceae bacterium]
MPPDSPDSSQPPPPPPPAPFPFRLEFPPELPISARAGEIVTAIAQNQVVILAGETGSGKTTQIPKMCLAAGRGARGRIACTQPRRVAALSISRRVAEELGVSWGREVGCKIRFDDRTSPATIIKFMTDGMLLAEVQNDPMLRAYDTVILDEAHERSLNIDFLLGHLRNLRFKRPGLKIIITSATIDTALFSKAFDDAPIIEVSGRTHPVEVIYAPLDEPGADSTSSDPTSADDDKNARAEALHYIDGAVEAVERIIRETDSGDILVFMPAERDIRETTDLLEGRGRSGRATTTTAAGTAGKIKNCEIIPLFGRLSGAGQQRVFAPVQRRKIVISTNIAETSLTIPGIRFVVDTGLARVSRYAPQSRTRRLPIEEIAQSSADQRKGRCGRVAEGVCIRLYSEKDCNERPRFAQPEIQRANLADVILRMKAFGLGDIERFPFINMPAAKSIRAGYALLEELGALEASDTDKPAACANTHDTHDTHDTPPLPPFPNHTDNPVRATSQKHLTPIGRELARLPVDPTVGRMILEARKEKCVREVTIIAAALSIQDPRERPLDKQAQADAAHRRFAHADSDFLTLLNIWETFHDEFETMSQSKLRKFCRDHFLSYTRMREWRDIHAQLIETPAPRDALRKHPAPLHPAPLNCAPLHPVPLHYGTPGYRAIHRSILSGLLGNIALRDDENGGYKSTHDRRVAIFPGSILYTRDEPKRKNDKNPAHKKTITTTITNPPAALVAAEIMETSRLYARTCARIDPRWVLELGSHLLKRTHGEPFWDAEKSRVLVKQRTRLHGLELETRAVSYGKIDPRHATEIFIREALVNDTIAFPLDCLIHNRDIRQKVEDLLTRARDNRYMNLDEGVYRFYAARLLPLVAQAAATRASRPSDCATRASRPCPNVARASCPRPNVAWASRPCDDAPASPGSSPESSGTNVPPMSVVTRTSHPCPRDNTPAPPPRGHPQKTTPPHATPPHATPPRNLPPKTTPPRDPPPRATAPDPSISSAGALVALVRERKPHEPHFLEMQMEDLRTPDELQHDTLSFPETVPLENRALPLSYAYKPGQTDDGVTIQVNLREAETLTPAALDWAVPGHLDAKVEHYLRAIPKELRRAFMPLAETAKTLAAQIATRDRLTGRRETIAESLAAQIAERFHIRIHPSIFSPKPPPDHLRVRIRVLDDDGAEICASRDPAEIHAALASRTREVSAAAPHDDPAMWQRARQRHEKPASETWTFGDIPDRIIIGHHAGVPVEAYPGLHRDTQQSANWRTAAAPRPQNQAAGQQSAPPPETNPQKTASPRAPGDPVSKPKIGSPPNAAPHGTSAPPGITAAPGISLRLYRTPEAARAETQPALFRLLELHLKYELAWT